jgi:hypothetical protein
VGSDAFSTGWHWGDALYRDLETHLGNAEHWHAAIYTGFSIDLHGQGVMTGVNATGDVTSFYTDTVRSFEARRSFASSTIDVADTMALLRDDFVRTFAPSTAFHGSRHVPGISPQQRRNIANSALAMLNKGIAYTWMDMLRHRGNAWDGTVAGISDTRCDGIVEYAYESNGIRVCGGLDPSRWNIAAPGVSSLDNHNDFHNHAYDPGELCPRIQAGDQASDSTFVETPSNPPIIRVFEVFSFASIFVPSIWLQVETADYSSALVRLTVSKDGGPFFFVRTEDPYGTTSPPAIVADWDWVTVPVGLGTLRQFGWWMGQTVGGPNYHNRNGNFEFRLVAVDRGGNVSSLVSRTVRIEWHGSRINCINKPWRSDPDRRISFVGGVHPSGHHWKLTVDEVIREIENGEHFWVERPTGDRVDVQIAVRPRGKRYIKTVADGDMPNNLLALPECEW